MFAFLTWLLLAVGVALIAIAFLVSWFLLALFLVVLGAWFVLVALESLLRSWSRARDRRLSR